MSLEPRFRDTCDEAPNDEAPKLKSLLYRKGYNILPMPYNLFNPPSHTSMAGVSCRSSVEFGG